MTKGKFEKAVDKYDKATTKVDIAKEKRLAARNKVDKIVAKNPKAGRGR